MKVEVTTVNFEIHEYDNVNPIIDENGMLFIVDLDKQGDSPSVLREAVKIQYAPGFWAWAEAVEEETADAAR